MKIFFGIDGGGTKTRIRVEDFSHKILFEQTATSSNKFAVGEANAVHVIENLVRSAPISSDDIVFGCIGLAGLGRMKDREPFSKMLATLIPKARTLVTTDAEILLTGGIGKNSPGIALIAGTGSIAIGRAYDGSLVRAGGFGWRLGDEGSAWWIAHEAICRTLRSLEERDIKTSMTKALLAHYGLKEPEEFITLANSESTEKSLIASGAKIITEAAENGDELAISIIEEGTDELALLVSSVHAKLGVEKTDLVMYGGVLENDAYIRNKTEKKLKPMNINILSRPKYPALDGAMIMARSLEEK